MAEMNFTLSSDAIDRAQANIVKAKGIANLAGQLQIDTIPNDTLSSSMWALVELLDEAHSELSKAQWPAKLNADDQGAAT